MLKWLLESALPDAEFDFEDGSFTGTIPQPIASDWDATVLVKGGVVHEYDISADEGVANGYGDFSSYWVSLHLDETIWKKMTFTMMTAATLLRSLWRMSMEILSSLQILRFVFTGMLMKLTLIPVMTKLLKHADCSLLHQLNLKQ